MKNYLFFWSLIMLLKPEGAYTQTQCYSGLRSVWHKLYGLRASGRAAPEPG